MKSISVIYAWHIRRTPYESAAAPTSHSAADPAELNVVCRSKSNLPNQTDSNTTLLPYLTHQLGLAHEWSGVWNGPKLIYSKLAFAKHVRLQLETVFKLL